MCLKLDYKVIEACVSLFGAVGTLATSIILCVLAWKQNQINRQQNKINFLNEETKKYVASYSELKSLMVEFKDKVGIYVFLNSMKPSKSNLPDIIKCQKDLCAKHSEITLYFPDEVSDSVGKFIELVNEVLKLAQDSQPIDFSAYDSKFSEVDKVIASIYKKPFQQLDNLYKNGY